MDVKRLITDINYCRRLIEILYVHISIQSLDPDCSTPINKLNYELEINRIHNLSSVEFANIHNDFDIIYAIPSMYDTLEFDDEDLQCETVSVFAEHKLWDPNNPDEWKTISLYYSFEAFNHEYFGIMNITHEKDSFTDKLCYCFDFIPDFRSIDIDIKFPFDIESKVYRQSIQDAKKLLTDKLKLYLLVEQTIIDNEMSKYILENS